MKNTSSDEIDSRTLTQVDADGNAYMVDIAGKEITERTAVAEGQILMQTKTQATQTTWKLAMKQTQFQPLRWDLR